jgi:hypothetical protein
LQAGIHPKVVSERLGHSTIAITLDTYSHAIPPMQSRRVEWGLTSARKRYASLAVSFGAASSAKRESIMGVSFKVGHRPRATDCEA